MSAISRERATEVLRTLAETGKLDLSDEEPEGGDPEGWGYSEVIEVRDLVWDYWSRSQPPTVDDPDTVRVNSYAHILELIANGTIHFHKCAVQPCICDLACYGPCPDENVCERHDAIQQRLEKEQGLP